MRSFVTALIVLIATSSVPTSAFAQDSGGARTVDAAWIKAMKANDIDGIVRCYAPDAVAWLPGLPMARGEKAIRSAYESLLSANTVKEVLISEAQYKTIGSNSVGWGGFSITLVSKDTGQPSLMTGRFTEVAEVRENQWVYLVDHASADPAGMETSR